MQEQDWAGGSTTTTTTGVTPSRATAVTHC